LSQNSVNGVELGSGQDTQGSEALSDKGQQLALRVKGGASSRKHQVSGTLLHLGYWAASSHSIYQ
jgi:hypothetical protein